MKIALLAWGSLIWKPGTLHITGHWNTGGPVLPIEFSRIERGRSLLQAGDVQIVSDVATLRGAFDLILESVGGESLTAALRLVGRDGVVAMFGNSSGQDSTVAFKQFGGRAHARLYAFFVYESGEPPTFGQTSASWPAKSARVGSIHRLA